MFDIPQIDVAPDLWEIAHSTLQEIIAAKKVVVQENKKEIIQ